MKKNHVTLKPFGYDPVSELSRKLRLEGVHGVAARLQRAAAGPTEGPHSLGRT